MKIEVKTRVYEFTHGRKPRGRGLWAFRVNGCPLFTPSDYSYTDAVKWAKEQAREQLDHLTVCEIEVLP